METLKNHRHAPLLLASLMFGTASLATLSTLPQTPLFLNTTPFALFATENISLDNNVTISSGDLGSNKKIETKKSDTINGNQYSGKLVANIPPIAPFTTGLQDKTFSSPTNSLPFGKYKNIIIQKDATLTLSGVYNLNSLELKENAKLIFNSPTTINIQFKLRTRDGSSILNGANTKPTDLQINYIGIQAKQFKNDKRDDDEDEMQSRMDKGEKEDYKNQKIGRPVTFGNSSFLNFVLTAPYSEIQIGKDTTLRGQVLARKIGVGKNTIISKEEGFEKESDVMKLVTVNNIQYISNEMILLLADTATVADILPLVQSRNGKIIGYLDELHMAKVEISASTYAELNSATSSLKSLNSPFIEEVLPNFNFE